jgi:WD40 repeat protein
MESMKTLRSGWKAVAGCLMLCSLTIAFAQRPNIQWIGGGETYTQSGFYFMNEQYFVTNNGWFLHFWRLSDNRLVRTVELERITGVMAENALACMPNGNQLVTAYVATDEDGNRGLRVQIWQPADSQFDTWTSVASGGSFDNTEPSRILKIGVSPDGQYIAVGGGDAFGGAGFVLYRVNGNQIVKVQDLDRIPTYIGINAIGFSPDSEWLFGGSYGGGKVLIYKRQGDGTFVLHQHETIGGGSGVYIERFAFTNRHDGKYVAVGSLPGGVITMYRYNPVQDRWRPYLQWNSPTTDPTSEVNDLCFFNGGDYLAVAYGSSAFGVIFYDPHLRVFQISYDSDPDNRAATVMFQEQFPGDVVTTVVLNQANTELISSTYRGDLRRWDVATQNYVALPNHRGYIVSLAWSPDGAKIATSSVGVENGSLPAQTLIWDFANQSVQARIDHYTASWIGAVAFSPDGNYIATVGRDLSDPNGRPVELWEASTGDYVALAGYLPYNGSGLVFSPNGQYLYAADRSGSVKAFHSTDGVNWTEVASVSTLDNAMRAVKIDLSPDGSLLAVGTRNKVYLLSTPNLNPVRTVEVFTETDRIISALDWSADGRYIAVGVSNVERSPVYLISTADWSVVRSMASADGVGYQTYDVSFTPDGCYLLAVGSKVNSSSDHNVVIWHTGTGTRVAAYNDQTLYSVGAAAFSPDGRYFAYGRDDGTLIVANNPFYRRAGDVDRNGCVDDADLLIVLFNFGSSDAEADLNCDGIVDDADLLIVLFNFGSGC